MLMNMGNLRKIRERIGGSDYKIPYISVAHCPRVSNLVPNRGLDTTLLPYVNYANDLIIIFISINENIRDERKL